MRAPPTPTSPDLAPVPSLEGWLAGHPRCVTGAVLLCAVAVRLALCAQLAGGPLPQLHRIVVESDGAFFQRWGEQLARGDWLQRAPLHPTYTWMRATADRALTLDPQLPDRLGVPAEARRDRAHLQEALWDRWMGGATFYQEPAYPYLVGLTYRLTGSEPWHVFAWQLALGVLGVLLLHGLALRLFSRTAALATGILAVLAPIPLLYDVTLLRDGLVVFVSVALAALMPWAVAGGRRRWLLLGLAFGAAALVKQSFLLFPVALGAWRLASERPPLRAALPAAGLVIAGMAVALLPAALRNLAVGVPPLAVNGSASAMLAAYHAAGASPVDLLVGPAYADALVAAHGSFLASLVAAARTHATAWRFLALELGKLAYAWHPFEAPNNVDLYLFREGAPLLRFLPGTFAVVFPLAAVGLAGRPARAAWPLLVAVAATVPGLLLSTVLSRYRAPLTALLLPLAGAGAARLGTWALAWRWRRLGVAAAGTALYLAWAASSPPGQAPAERGTRYAWAGVGALANGQPAYATLLLRASLRLEPGAARVRARLAQALLSSGATAEALVEVEAAGRSFDSAALRELHAQALAAAGRVREAIAEAQAARALDPARASARDLLEALQNGPRQAATPGAGKEPSP